MKKVLKFIVVLGIISIISLVISGCTMETPIEENETEVNNDIITDIVNNEITETSGVIETTKSEEITVVFDTTAEQEQSTEPVHQHQFSAATCEQPETCSCGAVNGEPNGHSWQEATCTSPKRCSVCNASEGFASNHNYSNGKCSRCGSVDPNYVEEILVWIPTNGGKKYHNDPDCSQMIDPEQVTEEEAIRRGFGRCKRCHG